MRKLLASKETLEKSAKNYFMRRENILGKANRLQRPMQRIVNSKDTLPYNR